MGRFDAWEKGRQYLDLEVYGRKVGTPYFQNKAGSSSFAGKASKVVRAENLQPLDLILIKDLPDSYYHVAVIVNDDQGRLWVLQSDIASGVHIKRISVENGKIVTEHRPQFGPKWDELYKSGNLELRRLIGL